MCEWAKMKKLPCNEPDKAQLGAVGICLRCNTALGNWKIKNLPFFGGEAGTSTLREEWDAVQP